MNVRTSYLHVMVTNGLEAAMILKRELIKVGLEAKDAEDALRTMAQGFVDAGYAKESYPQGIIEREVVFPTGLPCEVSDIAIPHCDSRHVIEKCVGIATLTEPIEMKMMGDPDTTLHPQVLFMLGIKEAHGQLEMLQQLIAVIQDKDRMEALLACKDADELYDLMAPVLGE